MADSKSSGEGFDLHRLQQLVELMEKHDLREVTLRKGSEKWHLRRGPQEIVQAVPMAAHSPVQQAPAAPAPAGAPAHQPAAASSGDGLAEIKSPMVGTFYRAASPEDAPFAKEGDRVSNDSVVCLIEAMKFFNQVKAECSGVIAKVLVKDGDPVEFGQPLFKVKSE
jgi:acetyl-CoA carboxylase biotin carboxyl carrier protein